MSNLRYKIVLISDDARHRDFGIQYASKAEAAEVCESYNWVYYEDGIYWDMEIEEM